MRQPVETSVFENFDRLCSDAVGPIGVGVSGGSDSLALFELAVNWAAQRGRRIVALTFDHRLRPASSREAEDVKSRARFLGTAHQTLTWDHPVKGQSSARKARHAALAEAVRANGGNCLMLGHTLDDQRETFLIRARQGSHWYGLAGMRARAVSPVWPEGRGVGVVRPVLAVRRSDLQDWLTARGRTWVSDPTNRDLTHERVRVRQQLAQSGRLPASIDRIQARIRRLRAAEDARLAQWLSERTDIDEGGDIRFEMASLPLESLSRLLSLLIQLTSGGDMPPRGQACAHAAERLLSKDDFRGQTLGGVQITRFGTRVSLRREPAAMAEAVGANGIWDNRFEPTDAGRSGAGGSVTIGPETAPQSGDWQCLTPIRLNAFVKMLTPP